MTGLALALLLTQTDDAAALKWFQAHAMPLRTVEAGKGLDDMDSLAAVLKDVQVVGMGECTHGSREVFQMKHRMLEFLVEKMGFTVFALEASLPDCVAMDRYVTSGTGDAKTAVQMQGFWTWSTEEVRDLIEWMRKYNQNSTHKNKLRVVGVDMQSRGGAANFIDFELQKVMKTDGPQFEHLAYERLTDADIKGLDAVFKDGMAKVKDPDEIKLLTQVRAVFDQALAEEESNVVSEQQRKVAPYFLEGLKKCPDLLEKAKDIDADGKAGLDLLARGSKSNVEPTAAEKRDCAKYAASVHAYAKKQNDKELALDYERAANLLDYFAAAFAKPEPAMNHRDKCMADNLEWITTTYLPGQKVMIWAHNYHISNSMQAGKADSMGSHLTARFGAKYFPIGFAFYEGAFQAIPAGGGALQEWKVTGKDDSYDGLLQKVGKPLFFVDFGTADTPMRTWLDAARPTRSIGAVYSPPAADMYFQKAEVGKLYRGMIFISKTTRARPLG
jgi:erythromycin esterase-like protein